MRTPAHLQGSVSILAHSLGSVLCYDILCSQPLSPLAVDASAMLPHSSSQPASPGNPANLTSMLASPPASPQRWSPLQQQQQEQQQQGQKQQAGQQQQDDQKEQGDQQHPGTPASACPSPGTDPMLIDLTTGGEDSPPIAGSSLQVSPPSGAGPPLQHSSPSQALDHSSPSGASLQQELSRLKAENQRLHLQLEVARGEGSYGGGLGWSSTSGGGGGNGAAIGHQQQQQQQVAEATGATWLLPLQFR